MLEFDQLAKHRKKNKSKVHYMFIYKEINGRLPKKIVYEKRKQMEKSFHESEFAKK
jgi:hypothetical protein